jgi:hypothetical protein
MIYNRILPVTAITHRSASGIIIIIIDELDHALTKRIIIAINRQVR